MNPHFYFGADSILFGIYETAVIFLAVMLGIIGALLIPNKKSIEKGELPKYESSTSNVVYGIGIFVFVLMGIFFFLVYLNLENYHIFSILNGVFLSLIGIGLIATNYSANMAFKNRSTDLESVSAPYPYRDEVPVEVMTPTSSVLQPQSPASPGAGGDEDIKVQIRMPIGQKQQQPRQQPTTPGRIIKVSCPKCGGIIQIDSNQKHGTIICSHCGFTGGVG